MLSVSASVLAVGLCSTGFTGPQYLDQRFANNQPVTRPSLCYRSQPLFTQREESCQGCNWDGMSIRRSLAQLPPLN